mmetsp:Transcript_34903/g.31431  ORF Transcript_34903/g.31431 Transcript_34903/m.31431 type:complete len:87 (+) Transcript_34903:63-323(+)
MIFPEKMSLILTSKLEKIKIQQIRNFKYYSSIHIDHISQHSQKYYYLGFRETKRCLQNIHFCTSINGLVVLKQLSDQERELIKYVG